MIGIAVNKPVEPVRNQVLNATKVLQPVHVQKINHQHQLYSSVSEPLPLAIKSSDRRPVLSAKHLSISPQFLTKIPEELIPIESCYPLLFYQVLPEVILGGHPLVIQHSYQKLPME